MLLVIDNYDSFTYNLVQYFGQLGVEQAVYRNDALSVEAALVMGFARWFVRAVKNFKRSAADRDREQLDQGKRRGESRKRKRGREGAGASE